MSKHILVTGGAGFIGSHTVVELLNAGFEVTIADCLCNAHKDVINKIKKITGVKTINFYEINLTQKSAVEKIFQENKFDAVMHFANLKAVGESVAKPLLYYENNLLCTLNLLAAMQKYAVYTMIFSSSATVYGDPKSNPIKEDFPVQPINPYGRTKLMSEQIMRDVAATDSRYNFIMLRYFNPVGAHKSYLIGEEPCGVPNNLVPYIVQVASGKLDKLKIFGDDYATKDGTGMRDYIHVVDLARGHVKALENTSQYEIINLGTGTSHSVLDVLHTFEKINNKSIPYEIVARRPGDIAQCYADPAAAEKELNWQTQLSLEDMLADAWQYELNSGKD
jgi:UDP-glucose 4-epimerase